MKLYDVKAILEQTGWLMAGSFMFKTSDKQRTTLLKYVRKTSEREMRPGGLDTFLTTAGEPAQFGEPFASGAAVNTFAFGDVVVPVKTDFGDMYTAAKVVVTLNHLFKGADVTLDCPQAGYRQCNGLVKWQIKSEVVAVSLVSVKNW